MPKVEGIDNVIFTKEEMKVFRRDGRKETYLRYYRNIRGKSLAALGGKCPCGEANPADLHIVPLTKEARKWKQNTFYRKIVAASNRGENPKKLGRIICSRCKNRRRTIEAIKRKEEGTGEFYWIGGERVEQVRRVVGISTGVKAGQLIVHPRYEDLGVDGLLLPSVIDSIKSI